jgi:UDP-glucuronate 4-epimerase
MAYWSFLEAILHQEPIKIFNYGKNRRDFTYIDDIVEGVVRALFSADLERYELINLGNNNPVAVLDFVQILEELSGKPAVKEMIPAQPGDVVATYAEIERAQKKLGFTPKTSLAAGLRLFVNWYKEYPALIQSVRNYRLSSRQ